MIILGFDPGIANCGWGAIDATAQLRALGWGVIETEKLDPRSKTNDGRLRAKVIAENANALVTRYAPQALAAEGYVFMGENSGANQAANTGRVLGALEMMAILRGLEHAEYPTQVIKHVVARKRDAEKGLVRRYVTTLLGLKAPPPLHASDALAAALCHWAKRTDSLWGMS